MPDLIYEILLKNRLSLSMMLAGALLLLIGTYVSIYKSTGLVNHKKLQQFKQAELFKHLEPVIRKYPLKLISEKLDKSLGYFMLEEWVHRRLVICFSFILPVIGLLMYISLDRVLNLWYTRLVTLLLCLMVPYYVFTLIVDFMKYSLRLKIPAMIDNFRSSFMVHYRIKPALYECSQNIDKSLGRIILKASDSSDLNESLCRIRDRIDDTWFNIFILLLINYRENGGELIAQLYKLNRTITRYNNIEKKKNKRLIWYEVFTVGTSIFSLPVILLLNKMILGVNSSLHYDATSSFAKIVVFSLSALLVVRVLRRM